MRRVLFSMLAKQDTALFLRQKGQRYFFVKFNSKPVDFDAASPFILRVRKRRVTQRHDAHHQPGFPRTVGFHTGTALLRRNSRRIEGYAYRVYDEDTVRRIEQILFLRSVRIPLRDIAVLLRGEDTREAIEIFRRRIAEMDAEIDQLTAVRRLLRYLQEKVSVSGSEGWKESVPLLSEDILLPRENSIPPMPSLPQDVRILSLPPLTVATAHAIKMGDFHEWAALAGWAEQSPDWEIRWASDGTEIMGGSLEEHLDYLQDRAAGRLQTGQLDLLLPIQKRRESQ